MFNTGNSFKEATGEFIANEDGMFDFTGSFLMKSDFDGFVKVSLMRNDVSKGRET